MHRQFFVVPKATQIDDAPDDIHIRILFFQVDALSGLRILQIAANFGNIKTESSFPDGFGVIHTILGSRSESGCHLVPALFIFLPGFMPGEWV